MRRRAPAAPVMSAAFSVKNLVSKILDDGYGMNENAPSRHRRKMQRVTMVEVAQEVGVSPSTVSLYLRKPALVSPALGEEIGEAIDRLGYVPSMVAGGLAAAGSRVVSIVVPSVRNAFFADTVAALQEEVTRDGLQLMLGHTEYEQDREEALVRTALSWAPAAIVVVGLEHSRATRKLLLGTETPVFEIWDCGQAPIDTAVGFRHRDVGAAAAHHLIDRGRRHLAFLGGRMQADHRARQRAEGFVHAVADRGLAPAVILNAPEAGSPEAGGWLLAQALAEVGQLDAVACSNDFVALGARFECQRRGIDVPEGLAIVGFGDLPFAASCVPPLTTLQPNGAEIGHVVGRLLRARLAGGGEPRQSQMHDTGFDLIVRGST